MRDLTLLGIPAKLVRMVEATLAGSRATVRVQGKLTEEFDISSGVRQGDALSAVLFNLVLEAAIRNVDPGGLITTKSVQICAYADDVAIIARDPRRLTQSLITLSNETQKKGLQINQAKTKYMHCSRNINNNRDNLNIEGYQFEQVGTFTYLGSTINENNNSTYDIKARIMSGNRCYHAYRELMKSTTLNKGSKLKIYNTIIRPVVTYGCESWTLTNNDEIHLRIFERKILRKIFGPVREEDGWRIRMNHELDRLIDGADIVRFVKAQRIRWLGHVERMREERWARKVMEWKPPGRRARGRPRKRWLDDVREDLEVMRVRNWRRKADDRDEWRQLVKQAKTHQGL